MDALLSSNRFETEIARYHQWRDGLTQAVNGYKEWLEANNELDIQQSIRFFDLVENLNKGRLMLAFLAEFSRGKSELINALFFSAFKERLLPSDVGRTTMCPTEIFHDPSEEPYLKLLSVETRYRDESISQLKNMPIEWSKIRLNVGSAEEMKKALKALADTKKVYALEARMLGLAPMANEKGEMPGEEELVEVPAWRYAMINYPHPLLTNGISILDTPGLNALGMEPELTVSTVPNAHAILFLLSIDTGVTKSDLEIWERYVRPGLPQKIAVLNKIDLMWDELKSAPEVEKAIARMVQTTAQHLSLPTQRIFAISAQKALLARIREDAELLARSGIQDLERFLAEQVIPMKRQILCKAVQNEIGAMMAASRASLDKRQNANQVEIDELGSLAGKSREVVQKLWAKITAEKTAYNASLAEYKVNQHQFNAKKAGLLELVAKARLEDMLQENLKAISESWTTVTLQRGMSALVHQMSDDFEAVFAASEEAKVLMQGVYDTFIAKFAFQKMTLPSLDLDPHRTKLKLLVHETDAFVKDPVNVLGKEKTFMVRKFYDTLVTQARTIYSDARHQAERWSRAVVLPLETQIRDHKAQLQARVDNLAKINEKSTTINEEMAKLRAVEGDLRRQREMIEALIERVSMQEVAAVPDTFTVAAARDPERTLPPEMVETLKLAAYNEANKRAAASGPLVSDDLMAELKGAKRDDPTSTQPIAPASDRTQKIPALDPDYRPEPTASAPGSPEMSQRTAESIRRLQEAKRILQKTAQK
jgi:dynamin family protein